MRISPVVRRKALAAGQRAWLDGLPALIASLERRWSITVGPAYAGGTEAIVVKVLNADGTRAVLKLMPPGDAAVHEITALRLAAGEGCARLLRGDAERGAMLLERLGAPLADADLPLERRREILCDAAARVWRPAAGSGLPSGAERARWLAEDIAKRWKATRRPCAAATVEHAIACAGRRADAHDDARARLVHGDVHQHNALARGDGFALIDPDGLLAEPEYDLGVILREDPLDALRDDLHGPALALGARTGRDAVAIWEWSVVERDSTGLLCAAVGLQPAGERLLAVADHIAAQADRREIAR
jgi:streptomycin 6-kinase